MTEWSKIRIGDVANINESSIKEDFEFNVIEYIDTSSVEKGKLIDTQLIPLKDAPSRARRLVKKNDILISSVRPNLEHYYFVHDCKANTVASTGFVVISPKENVVPYFLYCLLTTPRYTKYLTQIANSHTSTFPSFNPDIIVDSKLDMPIDLKEQQEISSVFYNIDQNTEMLRRQNKTLESIAQALFKHWFAEFEFPDENVRPYKSSGGKIVSSGSKEIGDIPEGWRVGMLGEIAEIITGKGLRSDEYDEKGLYPVLGANGEMGRTNNYLFGKKLIITGRVGTLGSIFIVTEKSWISDNVLISIPKEGFFYFTYFTMKKINYQSLNRGSTQPLITQTDLKNIEILIPRDRLVREFENISYNCFEKNRSNTGQITNLAKIRDTLLPKLMSGQIRVTV